MPSGACVDILCWGNEGAKEENFDFHVMNCHFYQLQKCDNFFKRRYVSFGHMEKTHFLTQSVALKTTQSVFNLTRLCSYDALLGDSCGLAVGLD